KIADFAMLGLLNKIAGGIFGMVKVAVILGALLIFFEKAAASLHADENTVANQSVLYTPLRDIGAFVFSLVIHSENTSAASSLQASLTQASLKQLQPGT
ncbi:MAG: CvpA family protein, partial [Bacteroidota bacterium]